MLRVRLPLIMLMIIAVGNVAEAHTNERAFILLLPTHLYIAGGALVVALSFIVIALIPAAGLRALERVRGRLGTSPGWGGDAPSLAVFAVAVALVIAGHAGSRDPLANPLPLVVWTLWWVGLTMFHALFGDLWSRLNPWRGPYRLVTSLPGLSNWRTRPPIAYPVWLGYWPAFGLLFGFAWFELVYPAPHDPAVLANAIAVYWGVTLVGMLLFGSETWLRHGEAFSMFFRIVGWLSPLGREPRGPGDGESVTVTVPGIRLLAVGTLPLSAVAFVLLALASVSFDGLSRTFWWLGLIGENPLQFPGRTALMAVNSFGLMAMFGALAAVYLAAVQLGRALAGSSIGVGESLGRMFVSIVPIAFGYHFAHYLPAFLVDVQYAARALSDPFALDWNLIGTRDMHVTASFLANHRSVEVIWNVQVGIIVAAHVIAVAIGHLMALRGDGDPRRIVLSQLPMTVLMIGYTLFGLWLLATPAVG